MSHSVIKMPTDSDLFVGKEHGVEKTYAEEDVIAFGKLSKDFNPLHFSEELASKTRFGGKIIHGMLTASLFSGVLSVLTPWCVYISQDINFLASVRIRDTIKATGIITAIDEKGVITVLLEGININQDNKIVIKGLAKVLKLKEIYNPPAK